MEGQILSDNQNMQKHTKRKANRGTLSGQMWLKTRQEPAAIHICTALGCSQQEGSLVQADLPGAQQSDGPQVSPDLTLAHSLHLLDGDGPENMPCRTKHSPSAWAQIQLFHLLTSDLERLPNFPVVFSVPVKAERP